jgi:protein TonB
VSQLPPIPSPAPAEGEKPRRPLRPLHGIPDRDRRGPTGFLVSALVHLAILLALTLPALVARQLDLPLESGGGGPGPAGGGGGGTGGTGGETIKTERLRFLQIAQPAAPKAAAPIVPPPVEKKPDPIIPPPPVEKVPEPVAQTASTVEAPPATSVTLPVPGRGGGTGTDGTAGNGPGSGGGVGSGVGTGRGSGNGPGTGGGPGDIYPPQVTNLAILPIPVPSKVRPYKLIAYFDVDEKGNAKLISFNPSKDGGYNKKIREMLSEVRFRPAVRWDGTTVRDTAWITAEAPR